MLIPQAMAYGALAGLPPIYGLYTAFVPLLVYAMLGTSRQLQVGPVAIVSMVVRDAVRATGSESAVATATQLGWMCGALQLGFGLLGAGRLVHLLPQAVVGGFTSAAAILIAMSQAGGFFGIPVAASKVHTALIGLYRGLRVAGEQCAWTTLFASACLGVLLGCRRLALPPAVPHRFLLVGGATFVTWAFDLHAKLGVDITGYVPPGLPAFKLPSIASVWTLLPAALALAALGFMESIAIAQRLAQRHGVAVCPSQELVALGGGNLLGSCFGAYPSAGSLSRSAVNEKAGAKTPLACLFTALLVAGTLAACTPLVYHQPTCVLSVVVIEAATGLVDFQQAAAMWRVSGLDAGLWMWTFAATLACGAETGLLLGAMAALASLLRHQPLSRGWQLLRGTLATATPCGGSPPRCDVRGVLCFANAAWLAEQVAECAKDTGTKGVLVCDLQGVGSVDYEAAVALLAVQRDRQAVGGDLTLTGGTPAVMQILHRLGLREHRGDPCPWGTSGSNAADAKDVDSC